MGLNVTDANNLSYCETLMIKLVCNWLHVFFSTGHSSILHPKLPDITLREICEFTGAISVHSSDTSGHTVASKLPLFLSPITVSFLSFLLFCNHLLISSWLLYVAFPAVSTLLSHVCLSFLCTVSQLFPLPFLFRWFPLINPSSFPVSDENLKMPFLHHSHFTLLTYHDHN